MGELTRSTQKLMGETMTNATITAMSTAEMLSLREETLDELTRRLESHLEDYLGERDWYHETGDPFAYEEVAGAIIHDEEWQGAGEYAFYTFKTRWPQQSLLFKRSANTPEELAEHLYEACVWAHDRGIDLARAGKNVSCRKLDSNN